MADDEVRLLAEAKKLPMSERVTHTNWKARNAAYEDIKQACQRVYEDTDPCLSEYGVCWQQPPT
jgi:cytoskeleton-associated protein 5